MRGKYEIQKRQKDVKYGDGFFTYAFEANKKRAIETSKSIQDSKVKEYLSGKIIYENK